MKAAIILFNILISITTFSQNTGAIQGTVIDIDTGEPVSYTHLTLPTTPYV